MQNCSMCHANGSEQNLPIGLNPVHDPQGWINPAGSHVRRLAADATFPRPRRPTSWRIPIRWERVATYAMPPARSSRLTQCMRSNRFAALDVLLFAGRWLLGRRLRPRRAARPLPSCRRATSARKLARPATKKSTTPSEDSSLADRDRRRQAGKRKACESCHGPGAQTRRVRLGRRYPESSQTDAAETDRTCLTCHLNQRTPGGRIASGHAKNEVGCTACHSVHGTGGAKLVEHKKSAINARCATCHMSEWAAFHRPYKHRLPEGAMSCVDCHNPHAQLPRRRHAHVLRQ